MVGQLGRHNLVKGTGRVMVDDILVHLFDWRPLMSSFKVDDYWSIILVEGTGWVLVDNILVHSVDYGSSMSKFKVDIYWSNAPVECWTMRFQYIQSTTDHRWATSRLMGIGWRHRLSAGWWYFSPFGRLDGICIIWRLMGGLVEWPLDGRLIVDSWLGRVDYILLFDDHRNGVDQFLWWVDDLSSLFLICGRWFHEVSQYTCFLSTNWYTFIHQSIYILFLVSGGVLVPMFLSWSILSNTSTIWATSSCRVLLFLPASGLNHLHMLLPSPRPNGDGNNARCWKLHFHIAFKQT